MKFLIGVIVTIGCWMINAPLIRAEAKSDIPVYNDHGMKDPFWPLVNEQTGGLINYNNEVSISDMILEGIMAGSAGQNIASINGQIVEKNKKVGQYTITQIGADFVILDDGNKSFTLKLKKEE